MINLQRVWLFTTHFLEERGKNSSFFELMQFIYLVDCAGMKYLGKSLTKKIWLIDTDTNLPTFVISKIPEIDANLLDADSDFEASEETVIRMTLARHFRKSCEELEAEVTLTPPMIEAREKMVSGRPGTLKLNMQSIPMSRTMAAYYKNIQGDKNENAV